MSDHEPSYYEIALTNRQVMVAFVILLSCLLGTFFAGVWVGRSEAQPQVATAAGGPAERDLGVEELDFFADGDLGASDEEPATPAALPDPVSERSEREARRPGSEPTAPASTVDASGGRQDSAAGAAPAPERRAPAAPAPAPAGERPSARDAAAGATVVQVFSSRDREQAERVIERLRNGGERPFLSPVEVEGQTMYRVRLGPYPDREEATGVAERVRRGYGLDTWITQ